MRSVEIFISWTKTVHDKNYDYLNMVKKWAKVYCDRKSNKEAIKNDLSYLSSQAVESVV